MTEYIQSIDWTILNYVQAELKCPFLDFAMPVISSVANAGIIFFVAAGVMMFFKYYRRCSVNILLCLAIGAVIANIILKPLIARERPCWVNEEIELLVSVPQDFSFPSGHALHSFMVAAVIFMYDKRIGIPALILAVMIAFSRLYLYVHFPSDVLCGALLGVVIAVGGYYLTKLIISKNQKLNVLLPERK